MEVKIGVQYASRELVVESDLTPEDVEKKLAEVLTTGGLFTLIDRKGHRVVIPVDKLAYVEIAESDRGAVGFGRL